MHRLVLFFLFLFVLVPAHLSFASPQQVTADSGAIEALSACRSAHGLAAGTPLAIKADGQMNLFDGSQASVTWKVQGKKLRVETSGPKKRSVVVSGVSKPFIEELDQRSKLRFSDAAQFFPEFLPMLPCAVDLAKPGLHVRYKGEEQIDDRAARHVHIWTEGSGHFAKADALLSDQQLFIDALSGEVLRVQSRVFSPDGLQNSSLWEIRYSDYRVVSGVKVPFRLERYLSGQWHSTIQLTQVDFNANHSPADFE